MEELANGAFGEWETWDDYVRGESTFIADPKGIGVTFETDDLNPSYRIMNTP